eukprot:29392_1
MLPKPRTYHKGKKRVVVNMLNQSPTHSNTSSLKQSTNVNANAFNKMVNYKCKYMKNTIQNNNFNGQNPMYKNIHVMVKMAQIENMINKNNFNGEKPFFTYVNIIIMLKNEVNKIDNDIKSIYKSINIIIMEMFNGIPLPIIPPLILIIIIVIIIPLVIPLIQIQLIIHVIIIHK